MDPYTELVNRFSYHAPSTDAVKRAHERVRLYIGQLAEELHHSLPDGREKAVAITKLEEAMYWANAAIARNQEGVV